MRSDSYPAGQRRVRHRGRRRPGAGPESVRELLSESSFELEDTMQIRAARGVGEMVEVREIKETDRENIEGTGFGIDVAQAQGQCECSDARWGRSWSCDLEKIHRFCGAGRY
jgi:hypothetical protein